MPRRRGSTRHRSQPVFVWLHLFDPHSPYTPPAPFATTYAASPYDGEIAYTDAALGRFFEQLERPGLLEAAAAIVVADHGESLGEHGERTHGTFLYDATVHVPLLVKWPSAPAHVVDAPVETADLAPTIAAMAGASLPAVDGQSLLPLRRRRRRRSRSTGLRRVVLPERAARLESAARRSHAPMEVHRGAASRALRSRGRSG